MESVRQIIEPHWNNIGTFFKVYYEQLEEGAKTGKYNWDIKTLPEWFPKMKDAFMRGTANKDSWAVKQTCKILKLPHTYQAIYGYLNGRSA